MAHNMTKPLPASQQKFAPEADGNFDVVDPAKIAALREAMADQYGIGTGRLRVLSEPETPE